MLILTRKAGEAVEIGDGVFVTVLEIRRGQIVLGFDAPRSVNIRRTELPRHEKNISVRAIQDGDE